MVCTAEFVFPSVFHTDPDDPSSSDDEGMPYTRPVKFKAAHGFKGPYGFEQIKVVQDLSGEHMVGLKPQLCFCSVFFSPQIQLLVSICLMSSSSGCQILFFLRSTLLTPDDALARNSAFLGPWAQEFISNLAPEPRVTAVCCLHPAGLAFQIKTYSLLPKCTRHFLQQLPHLSVKC